MSDYEYFYENKEANFGPPLQKEVQGGAHLTFDIILHNRRNIFGLRLPDGLHGAKKNGLYFPHGLIRFGESAFQCANRLTKKYASIKLEGIQFQNFVSWADDNNHWHMCLNILAEVEDKPKTSDLVSEIVAFNKTNIPDEFPWWETSQLGDVFDLLHKLYD
ncbi:hypothetical protein [Gracilimonas sp.]|uniref:hypothetical protein n=1 Tax=Gracilimonas sp. TaxID=1974203 RepID=UPI0032ED86D9